MKLDIKIGAKAIALESDDNYFKTGAEIEFVEDGIIDEEEGYYDYVFIGEVRGHRVKQYLESFEFKLIEE